MPKDNYFQGLRGIAIAAVVLIHSTNDVMKDLKPGGFNFIDTLTLRQFINFPVALFFFLFGYFVNKSEALSSPGIFYRKKLPRILWPYFFWSAIFYIQLLVTLKLGNHPLSLNLFAELGKILSGQTVSIYYYLFVQLQFILITPLVVKYSKNAVWYFITPVAIILFYVFNFKVFEIPFPYSLNSFFIWFFFYHLGSYSDKYKFLFNLKASVLATCFAFSVLVAIFEGFFLTTQFGFNSFGFSQVKLSSILASAFFILLLMKLKGKFNMPGFLVTLGDNSFGIYLAHMFIMPVLFHFLKHSKLYAVQPVYQIFVTILTISIVLIIIRIAKMVFSEKINSRVLGF
jgi:surface polysaccharide O-acyltransferase-like enzyme